MTVEFDPPRPGADGKPRERKARLVRERAKAEGNGLDATPCRPIKLLSYDEMVNLPAADFQVEGVVPRHAKSVLFGQSDSFKTFIAVDIGCSVSTGRSFHGHATKQCKVIFLANEGANAVGRKRIPAWMAYHNIPANERQNIFLITAETTLPNEASRANLMAAIRAVVRTGENFFLIIDVLRGTMNGSENDDEAAFAWTAAAEILIGEGAAILTVTHSPYNEDGRMRGHSHLWGSFDTRLQAEGDKDKRTTVLKVNRHKDHDSGGHWGFQLDEIEVDEHPGEMSLVPRIDDNVKAAKTSREPRLTKAAKIALNALQYAIGECGAVPPATNHIPAGVKCITLDQWREYAFSLGISASTESRARRAAFQRGTEFLIAAKAAAVWKDHAWPI
jgi:hypothetical protein